MSWPIITYPASAEIHIQSLLWCDLVCYLSRRPEITGHGLSLSWSRNFALQNNRKALRHPLLHTSHTMATSGRGVRKATKAATSAQGYIGAQQDVNDSSQLVAQVTGWSVEDCAQVLQECGLDTQQAITAILEGKLS